MGNIALDKGYLEGMIDFTSDLPEEIIRDIWRAFEIPLEFVRGSGYSMKGVLEKSLKELFEKYGSSNYSIVFYQAHEIGQNFAFEAITNRVPERIDIGY